MPKKKPHDQITDHDQAERARLRELGKRIQNAPADPEELKAGLKAIDDDVEKRMADYATEIGGDAGPAKVCTWAEADKKEATRLKVIAGYADMAKAYQASVHYIPRADAVRYAERYKKVMHRILEAINLIPGKVKGLDREQRLSLKRVASETVDTARKWIGKLAGD